MKTMQARKSVIVAAAAAVLGAMGASCGADQPGQGQPGVIEYSIVPTESRSTSPELLALGEQIYQKECVACHGPDGDGEGEATYLLYPRPRDFTIGRYRLISTWDGVPTDEDLFRTISRGMPGSAMPSWAHLPEETRWGLVHYVKSFSTRELVITAASEPQGFGGVGAGIISLPPEPPYDAAAKARAQELYDQGCAPCHGATGASAINCCYSALVSF